MIPTEAACSRCATVSDLKGESKTQAIKQGIIVRPDWHDMADCIRHLAAAVSTLEAK